MTGDRLTAANGAGARERGNQVARGGRRIVRYTHRDSSAGRVDRAGNHRTVSAMSFIDAWAQGTRRTRRGAQQRLAQRGVTPRWPDRSTGDEP
jgi:hypothetical protein